MALGKTINAGTVTARPWKQELYKFLGNYKATPHCTTNQPPATLLFGLNIRTTLSEVAIREDQVALHERDAWRKEIFQEGDSVIVKQQKHNKLTPPYDPTPYTVEKTNGIVVKTKRSQEMRHSLNLHQTDLLIPWITQ